jgi:hypothetical protein
MEEAFQRRLFGWQVRSHSSSFPQALGVSSPRPSQTNGWNGVSVLFV